MAKFTLHIKTDNEAFSDGNLGYELARILRQVADTVENDPEAGRTSLRDSNGNTVGEYKVPRSAAVLASDS